MRNDLRCTMDSMAASTRKRWGGSKRNGVMVFQGTKQTKLHACRIDIARMEFDDKSKISSRIKVGSNKSRVE